VLLGMRTHQNLSLALMILGLVGGGNAFFALVTSGFAAAMPGLRVALFAGLIFGGMLLPPLIFSVLFPAKCPLCGAAAELDVPNLLRYVCIRCGRRTDPGILWFSGKARSAQDDPALQKKPGEYVMAWIMFVFGVAALGGALVFGADSLRLLINGVTAEATVIKVSVHQQQLVSNKTRANYRAIIAYDVGGTQLTIERSWETDSDQHCVWPCYREGERLKVRYLPGNPAAAKVDSLPDLFLGQALFGLLGGMCIAASLWAQGKARRARSLMPRQ
jgi:hypothetical protein